MQVTGVQWDWSVCHEYVYDAAGIVDVGNGELVYAWPGGPIEPVNGLLC